MNDDYEGLERRTPPEPTHAVLDGLSNGARRVAVRIMWALLVIGFSSGGWLARQEFVNKRQDEAIGANAQAGRVIDRALAEAQGEINATIQKVVEDQQELRREMEQNREGIGILDAEKNAIRRDFEREHGRRP